MANCITAQSAEALVVWGESCVMNAVLELVNGEA